MFYDVIIPHLLLERKITSKYEIIVVWIEMEI